MRSFDSSDMHVVDVNWETDQQNHVAFVIKPFKNKKKSSIVQGMRFFFNFVPQLESHQFQ